MTEPGKEGEVLAVLSALGIPYVRHDHPPVQTVEEAEAHWTNIPGAHVKNLFLRNDRGNRHYLVILEASKKADLRGLARRLGEDRFSFASAERLNRYLGLEPGSVSPFGLIHDKAKEVQVIVDEGLKNAGHVSFHPNINTATLTITYADFERFLAWCGHAVRWLRFE